MAYKPSDPAVYPHPGADPDVHVAATVQATVKLLVAGALGVGKTTLIGAVSEIPPLRTEENLTEAGIGVDDLEGMRDKTTTTTVLDFGRITVAPDLALYLFGTPGQQRFWPMWEGLAEGAIGALVLVDSRRLQQSFEVLGHLERDHPALPLVVAVNQFPDTASYPLPELREALALPEHTPLTTCRAIHRNSAAHALITLVRHARSLLEVPR